MQPTPNFHWLFSKSPLEIPSCCPACLTRTWLLGENGNSCGEGRQEDLYTNNHTQAASAPHRADDLTVSLAGSERHRPRGLWGRGAQSGNRVSRTRCQVGSAWKLLLSSLSCCFWSWELLMVLPGSPDRLYGARVHPLQGTQRNCKRHCWFLKASQEGGALRGQGGLSYCYPASHIVEGHALLLAPVRFSPILTTEVPHLPRVLVFCSVVGLPYFRKARRLFFSSTMTDASQASDQAALLVCLFLILFFPPTTAHRVKKIKTDSVAVHC